ncbi:MAG: alkylated DNA repair dioxygenase AlkB [Parasphingorhabdus sp.]|jgi:alkylated DNA repair dioxygenase AlkB
MINLQHTLDMQPCRKQWRIPGGGIDLQILSDRESIYDDWLTDLQSTINWQQPDVHVFGKLHKVPRVCALYGDSRYRYSGQEQSALGWTETLSKIRNLVEKWSGCTFNSVLLNQYRNGEDRMGWHADDEPELGQRPMVVSLSLGASRIIRFRHKRLHSARFDLQLPHACLLMMHRGMQQCWQHAIPQQSRVSGARISLTFRDIQD